MGLTLQWCDFNQILKTPKWVVLRVFLQFTVMPFLGWILAILFDLPLFFAEFLNHWVLLKQNFL